MHLVHQGSLPWRFGCVHLSCNQPSRSGWMFCWTSGWRYGYYVVGNQIRLHRARYKLDVFYKIRPQLCLDCGFLYLPNFSPFMQWLICSPLLCVSNKPEYADQLLCCKFNSIWRLTFACFFDSCIIWKITTVKKMNITNNIEASSP